MKPVLIASAIAVGLGGMALAQSLSSAEALARARNIAFEVREGRHERAAGAVAMLTAASAAEPSNPDLWVALASAQMQSLATAAQAGGDPRQALVTLQQGRALYQRALDLRPDHPEALAGRGAMDTVLAGMRRDLSGLSAAKADMTRAVQLAPDNTFVRLQRAFFGINIPAPLRDTPRVEEDLKHLLGLAEGQRAGDVLHLMLGDLYAETGRAAEAEIQYRASDRAGSTTSAPALARLAALKAGTLPQADFVRLRSELGSNCAMCHGR